jgi:hypothetical protein
MRLIRQSSDCSVLRLFRFFFFSHSLSDHAVEKVSRNHCSTKSFFFFSLFFFFCVFIWILNTGNYSVQSHNSFIMYMCDYLPYYQQCERYRYTDMFFLIVIHVILLCPTRVWFFSPGHARSSTSWNEHYCLSCLKYRSLKAESYFSFHYISHRTRSW